VRSPVTRRWYRIAYRYTDDFQLRTRDYVLATGRNGTWAKF